MEPLIHTLLTIDSRRERSSREGRQTTIGCKNVKVIHSFLNIIKDNSLFITFPWAFCFINTNASHKEGSKRRILLLFVYAHIWISIAHINMSEYMPYTRAFQCFPLYYVHMHVCVYKTYETCIYASLQYMYIYASICMYYKYMYIFMDMYKYKYMYAYRYVQVQVHVCIWICTSTCIYNMYV